MVYDGAIFWDSQYNIFFSYLSSLSATEKKIVAIIYQLKLRNALLSLWYNNFSIDSISAESLNWIYDTLSDTHRIYF